MITTNLESIWILLIVDNRKLITENTVAKNFIYKKCWEYYNFIS